MTVTTFKAKVTPKLHGTTLAKLGGSFYDKMHEAAGNLLAVIKPHTIIRRARITNAIYDKVYNYSCEDDCEADSIIDIRPIGPRSTQDSLSGAFSQQFDIKKKTDTFAIEYVNGVKTLRLSKQLTARTVLCEADSLTIGATVTASGDVTDLDLDYLDHVTGSAAIKFNLSGSTGQGILTFALSSAVDIEDWEDLGALFNYFKFPLASALTSLRIRVGSDSSNYKEITVTAAHDRAFESDAWMLIRYLLSNASTTGTPDFGAIDYVQIAINYTSGTARNDVKIDNITAALGEAWEVLYYSNRLFTDTTGATWKETPTADTDLIRLDGASDINAYMYLFMLTLEQELKGKNATADLKWFRDQLGTGEGNDGKLLDQLKRKYPNQSVIRDVDYYVFGSLDGNGGDYGPVDD